MTDSRRSQSLDSVVNAVRWKVEHNRSNPQERVIGPAVPSADRPAHYVVELGDRPFDEASYRTLTLRFADGDEQVVGPPLVNTGRVVIVEAPNPRTGDAELIGLQDLTFLQEALAEALESRAAEGCSDRILDGRLDPVPDELRGDDDDLNEQQRRATAAVLSPGVQVVWGPPGTGKTRVIVEALKEAFKAGQSALLVSTANVAVDQAILKAHDAIDPEPGAMIRTGTPSMPDVAEHPTLPLDRAVEAKQKPLVEDQARIKARLTELDDDQAITDWTETIHALDKLNPDAVAAASHRLEGEQRLVGLTARIASLSPQQAEHAERRAELEGRARHLEALAKSRAAVLWTERDALTDDDEATDARVDIRRQEVERHESALAEARRARDAVSRLKISERKRLGDEIRALDTAYGQGLAMLRHAENDRDARRAPNDRRRAEIDAALPSVCDEEWWQNLGRSQIEISVELTEAIKADRLATEELAACLKAAEPLRDDPATDADRLLIDELLPLRPMLEDRQSDLRPICEALWEEQKDLREQLDDLERRLSDLRQHVIDGATIVASTLAAVAITPAVLKRDFDLVIVDEVSNAELPALVLVAMLAKSNLSLIGDFCQLGPVFSPNAEEIETADHQLSDEEVWWLTTEPFHHFGLKMASDAEHEPGCVTLTKQYRFGPAVEGLVNELVYSGCLYSDEAWSNPVQDGGGEIVLIDTSKLSGRKTEILSEGPSRYWMLGTTLALRLAELHQGASIGLIAPYRAQADAMKMTIADVSAPQGVEAGTIHSFQGRQFDVVVLDLVTRKQFPATLARATAHGDTRAYSNLRSANVALTRTSGRIYIIGDITKNDEDSEPAGFFSALRDRLDTEVTVIDAADLLVPDEEVAVAADLGIGMTPDDVGSMIRVYNAKRFISRFNAVLRDTKRSLDIWSPYYSMWRLDNLGDRWPKAAARIDATVRVRPPNSDKEREAFEKLGQSGATIQEYEQMHEKIVIQDDEVVWWGSFNVFQTGARSSEIMTELASPALAEKLRRTAKRQSK